MNFQSIHEARGYIREMSAEATAAIGDAEVFQYADGDVEIVEAGETLSESDAHAVRLGTVAQVLY